MSNDLRIGAASVDITPDDPVGLSGYAAREGLSTGLLDPVHARAAVFHHGAARIVIVALDLMDITREQADALRQVAAERAQTTVDNVCVGCTHTHSAPGVYPLGQNPELSERYFADLSKGVARAAGEATSRLGPAHLAASEAELHIGYNRRGYTGQGVCDDTLRGLVARDTGGRPICTVLEYACHAVCLGHQNNLISGDFAGTACNELERALGGNAVVLFMQGCCGDINPREDLYRDTEGKMTAAAARVVEAAGRIFDSTAAEAAGADKGLDVGITTVNLPYEPMDAKALRKELQEIDDRIAQGQTGPNDWEYLYAQVRGQCMRRLLALHEGPVPLTHMPVIVQHLRLGPVEMVALSGEVLFQIGLGIRERLGRTGLWVAAYCNGGHGYIPTDQAIEEGGYEPDSSNYYYGRPALQPGSAERLIDAAVQLVGK